MKNLWGFLPEDAFMIAFWWVSYGHLHMYSSSACACQKVVAGPRGWNRPLVRTS